MKKIVIISTIVLLRISPMFSQYVSIPDVNFLNALIEQGVDANVDGMISYTETEAVTSLDVRYKGISDLTGIESFINLTVLNCSSNQLTSLDVSNNPALTDMDCSSNKLTSLDVSNNTALKNLVCHSNQLTSLDVSKNTPLTDLDCSSNQLASLDVSNNAVLTTLQCNNDQLTSLDVSNNTALQYLACHSNQLTSLDVSNNTLLNVLYCPYNQLTSLDVSNNDALTALYCSSNQLTSLDVSKNPAITDLEFFSNQLTSLDVSNNTALSTLWCDNNQLTSLDVSNNISLGYLGLSDMPTLYRVCVWEMPFPPVGGVNLNITGSPNIYFTTECTVDVRLLEINKEVIIYPNPSNGIINIDIDNPLDSYIEIYNIKGRLIYSKPTTSNQIKIDISTYPKGVYFVKVKRQGVLKVGKVVW